MLNTASKLRKNSRKYDNINPYIKIYGLQDISCSSLRTTMNNSIFRDEWEKSKGAENIRNISGLIGYKQGFAMSIPILRKVKNVHIYIYFLHFHKLVKTVR